MFNLSFLLGVTTAILFIGVFVCGVFVGAWVNARKIDPKG